MIHSRLLEGAKFGKYSKRNNYNHLIISSFEEMLNISASRTDRYLFSGILGYIM
jgi:hypothetical protein